MENNLSEHTKSSYFNSYHVLSKSLSFKLKNKIHATDRMSSKMQVLAKNYLKLLYGSKIKIIEKNYKNQKTSARDLR